jgi:hypothetical protein
MIRRRSPRGLVHWLASAAALAVLAPATSGCASNSHADDGDSFASTNDIHDARSAYQRVVTTTFQGPGAGHDCINVLRLEEQVAPAGSFTWATTCVSGPTSEGRFELVSSSPPDAPLVARLTLTSSTTFRRDFVFDVHEDASGFSLDSTSTTVKLRSVIGSSPYLTPDPACLGNAFANGDENACAEAVCGAAPCPPDCASTVRECIDSCRAGSFSRFASRLEDEQVRCHYKSAPAN